MEVNLCLREIENERDEAMARGDDAARRAADDKLVRLCRVVDEAGDELKAIIG